MPGITPESYHPISWQIRHHPSTHKGIHPTPHKPPEKTNPHNNTIEQASYRNVTV